MNDNKSNSYNEACRIANDKERKKIEQDEIDKKKREEEIRSRTQREKNEDKRANSNKYNRFY